jgi:hypothetical protein
MDHMLVTDAMSDLDLMSSSLGAGDRNQLPNQGPGSRMKREEAAEETRTLAATEGWWIGGQQRSRKRYFKNVNLQTDFAPKQGVHYR